jgi:hypothetical protein
VSRLYVSAGPTPIPGRVHYVDDAHAFEFESANPELEIERGGEYGEASLVLGTVQLHFGVETGQVVYADGYCPRQSWRERTLTPPSALTGTVRVELDEDPKPGIGYRQGGIPRPLIAHDPANGWVRLGTDDEPSQSASYIEVATSTVLEIQDGHLRGLWLHPD